LSIAETNKIRESLGLPPLKVDTGPSKEELEKQQKEREDMEKEMKSVEVTGKIEKMRNKRLLTAKMAGKSIAEEVEQEDDDPAAWIEKSRKLEAEKALAAQRAKMMDEIDEEEQDADVNMLPSYNEKNLAGLRITHNAEQFGESEEILVLKDTSIVGKDGLNEEEDELESVHLAESTKRKKNAEAAKKKPLYDVYGENADKQELLPQYKEEEKDEGLRLGKSGEVDLAKKQQLEEVRKRLQAVKQEAYDLSTPVHLAPMADYLTTEEMAKFKKPERKKKKKSTRKKENLADIIQQQTEVAGSDANVNAELGSRTSRPAGGAAAQKIKEETSRKARAYEKALEKASEVSKILYSADIDDDEEFRSSLASSRKAPVSKLESIAASVTAAAQRRRMEEETEAPTFDAEEGSLVMSATSEFVRNLRVEVDERPAVSSVKKEPEPVAVKKERKEGGEDEDMRDASEGEKEEGEEDEDEESSTFDTLDEPLVSGSLAATLQFLKQKGTSQPFEAFAGRANDKKVASADDPAPNIRLEYLDEFGRPMTVKEAFRQQSYKFHGKKPGKNNQEKRMKQVEMEKRRIAQSTTDTPLHTVEAMIKAQQSAGTAHIVLQAGSMAIQARAEASAGVKAEASGSAIAKRKAPAPGGGGKRPKN